MVRPPAPADAPQPFPIVGLGASAGGLEAFEQFLHAMPADSGLALVLVQHLDPSHASILKDILQRTTDMPVVEAQDQQQVLPNHAYVIPPNRDMVIFHGRLQLSVPNEPRSLRMPIDTFLRSLAEDLGERAAGIVLSGTGTDGTLGLRAIHGAGGLCLAQDPATARYDGMPNSAIRSDCGAQVMAVDQMPRVLLKGMQMPPIGQPTAVTQAPVTTAAVADGGLSRVLMLLRSATGHDFSMYKKSTIGRRVQRRMARHGIEDVEVYARYLRENPGELRTLFSEMLINVTSFFRDPEAFVALRAILQPVFLMPLPPEYVFRVWVSGCATGEEAYSIAIVLREIMDDLHRDFKVLIYSTDLDDQAIATARAGLYPPNIAQDMSPERLRRFFSKSDEGYRIKADLRDMVVFAVQSVIKDPPFTRLDLLSCRNLMIYLEPEMQNRLIPIFHYALRTGGILLLSPSESVGNHTDLFEAVDRKWKIYRSKPSVAPVRALMSTDLPWTPAPTTSSQSAPGSSGTSATQQLADLARRSLLQAFAPAAVIADTSGKILYFYGDTGKYLRPAPGHPTLNIVDMAREGLAAGLRDALQQAATHGTPTLNLELHVNDGATKQPVGLSVRLVPDKGSQQEQQHQVLLISFQDLPVPAPRKVRRTAASKGETQSRRELELERQLEYAKEHMNSLLEEQQASNEELKSTNEELQSTNEELQSTNEELETSKEELQSVNEELVTVNSELQTKVELMAIMQDDMKNLLDNIRLGTIFLDRHLVLRRFTLDATRVYRLQPTDVGRPLADIRCALVGDDMLADANAVLETLIPVEREVRTEDGTWYLARVQPYRTADNVIDGVVLTFADVTDRVHALAARGARDLAVAIVNTVPTPLLVLDRQLTVLSANKAFSQAFAIGEGEWIGKRFFEPGSGLWDNLELRRLLQDDLPRDRGLDSRAMQIDIPGIGMRQLALSARRIVDQPNDGELFLLSIDCSPATPA
jgi:two-component system, chemotaxis family, CheB/CheR fusion protein